MAADPLAFERYKQLRARTNYAPADIIAILRTRDAEYRGLIRFAWDYDSDPDMSWADQETLRSWHAGDLVVLGCVAEVPRRCDHCGHELGEDSWEVAASLCGIVVRGWDDPYCRLIEAELAHEAGVL